MRLFSKFILLILTLNILFFSSCSDSIDDDKICPQCNMPLSKKSNHYTAKLSINNKSIYFDDIGCMILYADEHKIDLKSAHSKVFTNDTNKYIDASLLHYKIDEQTPMHYGFGAYEKKSDNTIVFDQVVVKMLRGENMTNPKIRKQILGY